MTSAAAAATMGPKLAFSQSAQAQAPAGAAPPPAAVAPPVEDGTPNVSGVYRVDVHTDGLWAEVDRFDN
ncbi:MAG: hypothetical protein FJX35_03420 [Alphaproteobacteria bacterium]|nr:hypothetical protein [Alphaproteobacteria bacterium]